MQASSSSQGTLPAEDTQEKLHDAAPGGDVSSQTSKDLEKGEPEVREKDGVDQGGQDGRQIVEESNLVGWDGPNDPGNPQNWPKSKKYMTTVFYASLTFCLTFSSSVFSTATEVTAELYGVSNEVMVLGTSLFVLVCGRLASWS